MTSPSPADRPSGRLTRSILVGFGTATAMVAVVIVIWGPSGPDTASEGPAGEEATQDEVIRLAQSIVTSQESEMSQMSDLLEQRERGNRR